ncbi:hypothetical protein LSAT2_007112, partial [Lamellibrachia satsuma]
MAIEQTYNKEEKTQLFKGITQQQASREKYRRALSALPAVSDQTSSCLGADFQQSRIRLPAQSQSRLPAVSEQTSSSLGSDFQQSRSRLPAVSKQTKAIVHVSEGSCRRRR